MTRCYPHAWESLWRCFDRAKGDRIQVPIPDLVILVKCRGLEAPPPGLVLEEGRRYATVARAPFFDLLVAHGAEKCGRATP